MRLFLFLCTVVVFWGQVQSKTFWDLVKNKMSGKESNSEDYQENYMSFVGDDLRGKPSRQQKEQGLPVVQDRRRTPRLPPTTTPETTSTFTTGLPATPPSTVTSESTPYGKAGKGVIRRTSKFMALLIMASSTTYTDGNNNVVNGPVYIPR